MRSQCHGDAKGRGEGLRRTAAGGEDSAMAWCHMGRMEAWRNGQTVGCKSEAAKGALYLQTKTMKLMKKESTANLDIAWTKVLFSGVEGYFFYCYYNYVAFRL